VPGQCRQGSQGAQGNGTTLTYRVSIRFCLSVYVRSSIDLRQLIC
jgi:hypothetical protein